MAPVYFFIFLFVPYLSDTKYMPQESCYYDDRWLPITFTESQLVYFKSLNKIFLFDKSSYNIYKWQTNKTNAWFNITSSSNPHPGRSYANNIAIINNTKAYFIAVDNSNNGIPIQVFDGVTERFINHSISNPLHPVIGGCVTNNDTHIFLVGGYNTSFKSDLLQIYNAAKNEWSSEKITISGLNQGMYGQSCYLVDHTLYVFGGYQMYENIKVYKTIWSYNTFTSEWNEIGSKSVASYSGSVAYLYPYIYVIGGQLEDYSEQTNIVDVFDVEKEIIVDSYHLNHSVSGQASVILNESLFIFGGGNFQIYAWAFIQVCDLALVQEQEVGMGQDNKQISVYLIIGICVGVMLIVIVIAYMVMRRRYYGNDDEYALMAINHDVDEQVLSK